MAESISSWLKFGVSGPCQAVDGCCMIATSSSRSGHSPARCLCRACVSSSTARERPPPTNWFAPRDVGAWRGSVAGGGGGGDWEGRPNARGARGPEHQS